MIILSIGIVLGILVLMITCNALILLRDKKTINRIDSRISEIDIITKEIQQNTDKINECIAVKIYPTVKSVQIEQKGAVKLLVDIHEDVSYRQRLKAEYPRRELYKDAYDNTETSEKNI